MVELMRVLTFVADDGTMALTAVAAVLLISGWGLAVSCCVQLVSCVERATRCHHHDDLSAAPRQLRESLREECKDFCLKVASSNASGQRITRNVVLQHAFDAFSGSSTGLIADAKDDVRPELWAPAMRSLAIDVFIERNRERAMLLARCANLLDSVCRISAKAACGDDSDGVAWECPKGKEEEKLGSTLLQLAAWSNCGCLRRHICSHCGTSDFSWLGHAPEEMTRHTDTTGGHCARILPLATDPVDDDLAPRYCEICRDIYANDAQGPGGKQLQIPNRKAGEAR